MLSSKAKRELKIDQRQVLIESIEIGIASPQQIYLRGSRQLPNGKTVGLIKNSKTVNYKKFTPFRDGLFCERIFGPVTSLVCACGKKQPHSKITFCEKCEVEYIDQRSRRYRLGYISLLSPVTHIWYLKGRPSYLSLFLGKRKKTVVSLAYCNGYLIDHIPLKKKEEYQSKCAYACAPKGARMKQEGGKTGGEKLLPKAAAMTFGQEPQKGLPVSHLSKIDNLLNNNLYKSKPLCKSEADLDMAIKAMRLPLAKANAKQGFAFRRFASPQSSHSFAKGNNFRPAYTSVPVPVSPKGDTGMGKKGAKRDSFCVAKRLRRFVSGPNGISSEGRGKAKLIAIPFGQGKRKDICAAWRSPKVPDRFLASGVRKPKKKGLTAEKDLLPLLAWSFVKKSNFLLVTNYKYKYKSTICKKLCKKIGVAVQSKALRWPYKSNIRKAFIYDLQLQKDRYQKAQNLLKINRFLSKNRAVLNKNDFYRGTAYGKYFYTRQQCLPFLPSFVSHFYLRDALLNFMYSSPISEDIPILEYCNTKRIEPLQDVHKFMARQTVDKFKNVDLRAKNLNLSFPASLPKVLRKQQSLAKLNFAQRGGEPQASSCSQVHVKSTLSLVAVNHPLTTPVSIGVETKIANLSKTSLSAFRLKMLYHGKKHFYLNSFFKKISQQSTLNSANALITKNINEETDNTTLSNLELTAIREILSYTGGGAIQQLLKQFDPHDLCKFLVAERQILRALYQKHIDFTRDGVKIPLQSEALHDDQTQTRDLRSSRALTYVSKVSEYQNNFSKIEKSFFSTAVPFLQGDIKDNGFLPYCTLPAPLSESFVSSPSVYKSKTSTGICKSTQIVAMPKRNDREKSPLNPPLNGLSLKEKRPSKALLCNWGLQNKKTPLYQKKEIMRISRRIYKIARRLKVAQLLTLNLRRPEWMILSHLPVLPPDLRPILQMSEKVIVASDLNIMYQRVIYRNNRHLRVRFIDFQLVTAIQRLVQDAVDRLMENGKGGSKPYYTQGGRPLKSLSDILKGKKGRFRLNLLGKRVDFSGRSVIVVAPSLKIHECGLPKDIALELYHYFLLRQLIVKKYCASIVTAKKMIKSKSPEMWDVLREVMYHHPVLLNRAPTLHRLGIQAFQPKLVVGNAIWLHPLVCSGFNADFDGDQMGVHLPLSFAARAESWDLLWSRNNLLSPATGQPMLVPSQDMVLGFYYMTALPMPLGRAPKETGSFCYAKRRQHKGPNIKTFKTAITAHKKGVNKIGVYLNPKSIITNYQNGILKLHTPVWLHWGGKIENENNSATPFELRISGFGAQQCVYENYISNNLFSGHTSRLAYKSLPLQPMHGDGITRGLVQGPATLALIQKPTQSEALHLTPKNDLRSTYALSKASFIFIQSKASYIRTTAGRVLMNNILKSDA